MVRSHCKSTEKDDATDRCQRRDKSEITSCPCEPTYSL